jgi:hypothetical protein
MLLKWQINTNTNKNGFLPTEKCLERALIYSYLVSIILNLLYMFVFTTILIQSGILRALVQTLLALAQTLILLAQTLLH